MFSFRLSVTAAYILFFSLCLYLTLILNLSPLPRLNQEYPETTTYNVSNNTLPLEILKILEQPSPELGFNQAMKLFPWKSYNISLSTGNQTEISSYSTALLLVLLSYITAPHKIPSNTSCFPPKLVLPPTCVPLQHPRKVGVLLQFGFDVDALEIHLHELNDLVDKFFIIESISTHSRHFSWRPLLWDRLKHSPAFEKFSRKIVHFIMDDTNLARLSHTSCNTSSGLSGKILSECIFALEILQERLRWEKFLEWNSATNYFSDEDIVGFGDIDEIPWRGNIFTLKHCKMPSDPVDIGIWFPMNGSQSFFATDWPVKGKRFTLGDPTFWTLKSAKAAPNFPSRMRGKSKSHLVGGLHMSCYKYPPFRMLKRMSCTECLQEELAAVIDIGMNYASGNVSEAEKLLWKLGPNLVRRIHYLDELKGKEYVDEIRKIPWYLDCNKRRYPYFYSDYGDLRMEAG